MPLACLLAALAALFAEAAAQDPLGTERVRQLRGEVRADGQAAHSECHHAIKEFEKEFKEFHVCKEHHTHKACEHFLDKHTEDLDQEDMKALVPLWDDGEEKPPVLWAGFWDGGNKCDHFDVLQDAINKMHGFRLENTKVGKALLKHKVITPQNNGVCDWGECGHYWWKGSKMMGAMAVLTKKPKIFAIINKPSENVHLTSMYKTEIEEMMQQKQFEDRRDYEPEFTLFNWNEKAHCGSGGLHTMEEKAKVVTKHFKCVNRICKGDGEWQDLAQSVSLAHGIDGVNHSLPASPHP